MARRFVISTRCPLCGDQVEAVPVSILKNQPHYNNAEYVITHSGYKQYIHSNCWYGMIEEQKKNRKDKIC